MFIYSLYSQDIMTEKIILGIDPGTSIMGYGIIRVQGNQMKIIDMGVLDLRKFSDHFVKIKQIFKRTLTLIDEFHPDELAIEAPFFGENIQSMLKLGRAQGAAISAALSRDIPIFEYAPRKIKMAITGQGAASKEQVAKILQSMLSIPELPKNLDATDGLAAAVCHFFQKPVQGEEGTARSWKAFIQKNPERMVKR
ncbi:MAG: crossover junction endodeoxyribonuclease RuvC [Fibrobacteraceae bacterium]